MWSLLELPHVPYDVRPYLLALEAGTFRLLLARVVMLEDGEEHLWRGNNQICCLSSNHKTTNNSTALENQKIISSLLRLCSSWWNFYIFLFFGKKKILQPYLSQSLRGNFQTTLQSLPYQQKPLSLKGHIRQDYKCSDFYPSLKSTVSDTTAALYSFLAPAWFPV